MSDEKHSHQGTIRTYLIIFAILIFFTAITVWAAFTDFGQFNTVIALVIAFIKATLVMLFFMHLKGSSSLLKIFVIGAFAWVTILIGMTLNDFATRKWGPQLDKTTWISRTPHQYAESTEEVSIPQHH